LWTADLCTNFYSSYEAGLTGIVLSQCPRTGVLLVTGGTVEMKEAVKNSPKLATKLLDMSRTILPSDKTQVKKTELLTNWSIDHNVITGRCYYSG
jgi:hypothetical protein